MDTPDTVPASEFTRNFGRYRMRAQREPVAVSSHGQITGYFVGPDEYEEFKRFRESRRSFATAELSERSHGAPQIGQDVAKAVVGACVLGIEPYADIVNLVNAPAV